MRTLTTLILSAVLASASLAAPASAEDRDDGRIRRHWQSDDDDDRRSYRHDRGHHRGWYKYKNRHRHDWSEVTVYTAPSYPVYASRDYSEVRCTNSYNPLGLLIGGALGGVAGSTVGKGTGRDVAIGTGAVLGSMLGQGMVSQRCDEYVFSELPIGRPVSWQAGPEEAYALLPTRDFRESGRYCREYQAYATVGGRKQQTFGTACMAPDGSWEIIN